MTLNTGLQIGSFVLGLIGTAFTAIASIDQIKNGDKRAEIAGAAAGQQIAQVAEEHNWYMCCGHKIDLTTGQIIG